jgi:putative ABC transport system substrate-binding protein
MSAFGGKADIPPHYRHVRFPFRKSGAGFCCVAKHASSTVVGCDIGLRARLMRRRDFIGIIGGAAAWPIATRAAETIYRIGVLTTFSDSDALAEEWLTAFRKGLDELGWRDGRNFQIDYRWAAGDPERLAAFAKDLTALNPDVIFAVTTPAVASLLRETHSLPIVFAQVSDPVGSGFVASLARPSGNITGFTNINVDASMGGKWLELVMQIAPAVKRVIMIYNPPTAPFANYYLRPFEAAGAAHGVQARAAAVDSDADIENALASLAHEPGGGLVVLPDSGLLSYGIDSDDMFHRAASYVDRILKGEKPAELPVQAPTKFEMVVNLKTAKALGFEVPTTLLATADEVIE